MSDDDPSDVDMLVERKAVPGSMRVVLLVELNFPESKCAESKPAARKRKKFAIPIVSTKRDQRPNWRRPP
ncbi:MAG: hypothetical protein ACREQ2_10175 [Candidatus Binatia bacterium]